MTSIRHAWLLFCVFGIAAMGETVLSIGDVTVEEGQPVDIRVSVSCPVLMELNVQVAIDTGGLQLVPDSLWVNEDRLYNVYDPAATPTPETFMVELSAERIWFWLQRSGDIGDSGWRVSAHSPGSGGDLAAVFGFAVQGTTRGIYPIEFPADEPPVARNTNVLHPDEPVASTDGEVLVYLPPGPVMIMPPGGDFNQAVEVTLGSEHSTGIVYTTDGSDPAEGGTPYEGSLLLNGTDGQTVVLNVVANGEAGTSTSGSAEFRFDMTPPAVSVDSLITASGKPLLSGSIDESAASVAITLAGETYSAQNHGDGTWTLDLGAFLDDDLPEGTYDVSALATDPAGNQGTDDTTGELTIDMTPPAGTFVVGLGGPAYVASVDVILEVSVSGAFEARFRNWNEDWSSWQGMSATVSWVLPAGDGPKTVFAEFRDEALNVLALQDTVGLDTVMPSSTIATSGGYGPLNWPGEISGSAADGLSGVVAVEVRCGRTDTGEYWNGSAWTNEALWVSASGTQSWSLALPEAALPEEVEVTVEGRALDAAGNLESPAASSSFYYDASAPSGSFAIDAPGVEAVGGTAVTLVSSVVGATQMRFRNQGGAWSGWEAYTEARSWSLEPPDGAKTVHAEYRDAVGNALDLQKTVLLDTQPPTSTITTSGGYGPDSWLDGVLGTAVDDGSGVASVEVTIVRRPPSTKTAEEYWDGSGWSSTPQSSTATLTGESWVVPLPLSALLAGGDDRSYTVSAVAADHVGNSEVAGSESDFLFDSRIPSGGFSIGEGNPMYVNRQTVTLYNAVTAENPLEMRFRGEGQSFPPSWDPYAETVPGVVLPGDNGPKTIYGEFRDTVSGNTLSTSDSVILDLDDPLSAFSISGVFGPASWPGVIEGTSSDVGPSGVAHVDVTVLRNDGAFWNGTDWQGDDTAVRTIPSGGVWAIDMPASALLGGSSYFLSSQAMDRAGNTQSTASTVLITFDSDAPTGSFVVGVGDPVGTPTRDLELSIEVVGAVEMAFRNEGGAWGAWVPYGPSFSWTLTGGEGLKTVFGRFRDEVGNTLEVSDDIVFDSTPPESTFPLEAAYGPATWPGVLVGSASDNLSGVALVEVAVMRLSDGLYWSLGGWTVDESWLTASGTDPWSLSLDGSLLADGEEYAVSSRATDGAGNPQSPVSGAGFVFDATPAISTIDLPARVGPATWSGVIPGSASDDRTGVAIVEVAILRVLGSSISHWDGAAWQSGAATVWLSATGTTQWELALDIANLDNGASYTISSRATDSVGNAEASPPSREVVFDSDPPAPPTLVSVLTDTGLPDDWVTSDRTVEITGVAEAGDDELVIDVWVDGVSRGTTSVEDGQWIFDYRGVPLADGEYAIQAVAIDAAGNVSEPSAIRVLTIDTQAPEVTIASPPHGGLVNGAETIAFAVDDPHAAEGSVNGSDWLAIESGAATLASLPGFDALPEGAFTLWVRDRDLAGNEGSDQHSLIKDTMPPAGYSIQVDQPYVFSGNQTDVTLTVSSGEIGTTCHYRIADRGGNVVTGQFDVSFSPRTSPPVDVSSLEDGTLDVSAALTDSVGNTGVAIQFEVEKDTQGPSAYTVAFDVGAVNAVNVTAVSFTVFNGEDGATYQYTLQSGIGGTPITDSGVFSVASPQLGPIDATGLADGPLTLVFRLTDPFGNTGPTRSKSIDKDTIPPAVPAVVATSAQISRANRHECFVDGTAEPSSFVDYAIADEGVGLVEGTTAVDAGGAYSAGSIDVSTLQDGILILTVRGRDAAGNVSDWGEGATIPKDTIPPPPPALTTFSSPVNAASASAFSFSGTSEPEATLDYVMSPPDDAVRIEGSVQSSPAGMFEVDAVDITGIPDGPFTITLIARDAFDNSSDPFESEAIAKDTVAPTVTVDAPIAGSAVNGDEVFVWTASEAVTVVAAVVGEEEVDLLSGTTAVGDLPGFETLADGVFTVMVSAEDAVGNPAAVEVTLSKDTMAPQGYAVAFDESFVDGSRISTVSFTMAGAETGSTYHFEITDGGARKGIVSGEGAVTSPEQQVKNVDIASLAAGTLTLSLRLVDEAGNQGPDVTSTMDKGISQVVSLHRGWNTIGIVVETVNTFAEILADAAARPDGAAIRGPWYGYVGSRVSPVGGAGAFLEFGHAYRVFCDHPGTLRVQGVPVAGWASAGPGWTLMCPGSTMSVSSLEDAATVWRECPVAGSYIRVAAGASIDAGDPIWVWVPAP